MGKINEQQNELDFTDGNDELKQKVLNYVGKVPYMNKLKQRLESGIDLTEKDIEKIEKYYYNDKQYEDYYSEINKDQIEKIYKEKVFESIKDLYGTSNQTWGGVGERGPSKKGGVINVKSLNELLQKEDGNFIGTTGGEWSIINYFDTNPKVREYVLWNYQKENSLKIKGDLKKLGDWIFNNRETLFKSGYMFDHMVKLNFTSLKRGLKNEAKAINYIEKLISKRVGDRVVANNLPGSSSDRSGVDFKIIKNNGKEVSFQAKPLGGYEEKDGKYIITSYKIRWIENKKNIDFFIFASDDKEQVYVFKNRIGEFMVNVPNENQITFNYPPEKLLKETYEDNLVENFFDTCKFSLNEGWLPDVQIGSDVFTEKIHVGGDEMVESFFDTGKLINEIGDEETMGKLKRDIETIEKKSFDDLVSEYEIGKYINQFKDTYERQKKDFVYDKDNTKLTLSSFIIIWEEIFKLIQNLYILGLYKNVGKPSSGEKRSGSYSGVISSILRVVDDNINNGKTNILIKLLSNLNNHIKKLTTNEELIPKLRDDLWLIMGKKLKGKTGSNILSLLSKKVSSYSEYENSFLKRGFLKSIGKKAEGRIHDLKGGELSNMINSEWTEKEIFDYVKNNIEKYVSSVDNIEKYDIISDRDFMLGDKTLINSGDKIEIKKNKHSEGQDSYYSEPLASPVKSKYSNIRTDELLKQKYTNVIDKLYNWLGGAGKNVGEDILKKIIKGTKGIFLDKYIFIPIENIEFYLSKRGYNNCTDHIRLAIRYRLKPGKPIYELTDNNNLEEIPYSGEKEVSKDYVTCGGEKPKVIIDGSQIIKENSDFISEYVENFLDL